MNVRKKLINKILGQMQEEPWKPYVRDWINNHLVNNPQYNLSDQFNVEDVLMNFLNYIVTIVRERPNSVKAPLLNMYGIDPSMPLPTEILRDQDKAANDLINEWVTEMPNVFEDRMFDFLLKEYKSL